MKRCKGCGAVLQHDNPQMLGYSPKAESEYCQRCFRLKHYDDLVTNYKDAIDYYAVAKQINQLDTLLVWVVDVFDFESNMVTAINRLFNYQDIVMIATKRDLLPQAITSQKLKQFIESRLAFYDIEIKDYVISGKGQYYNDDAIWEMIHQYRHGRAVTFIGQANAGKSTILNRLIQTNDLTVSKYPGTTLDLIALQHQDYQIYDTPGFNNQQSMLWVSKSQDLKAIVPTAMIKPKVFQLYEDQSFAIAGLVRLDIEIDQAASVIFYFANQLPIHRGKIVNADRLWSEEKHPSLKPLIEKINRKQQRLHLLQTPMDIVIYGLGWICIHGNVKQVTVTTHQAVEVITRKAMI